MAKETGSAICRGSRVIGVTHLHPSGSVRLSSQDVKTAHSKQLRYVCVETPQGRRRCYRFKTKRK